MQIQTLPHAHQIRLESRLIPSQVSRDLADAAALEVEIEARIETHRAIIAAKLANVPDTADNQIVATEALQLRVLASLFGSAGYLNPAYWERAQALKAESADLLDDLTNTSPDEVAAVDEANGGSSNAATVSLSRYSYDETLGEWVVNA